MRIEINCDNCVTTINLNGAPHLAPLVPPRMAGQAEPEAPAVAPQRSADRPAQEFRTSTAQETV